MALRHVLKTLPLTLVAAALGCTTPGVGSREPELAEIGGNGGDAPPVETPAGAGAPAPVFPSEDAGFPVITRGCAETTGKNFAAAGGSFSSMPTAFLAPSVEAETAPPSISGGTMLTTADGSTVVAADPDRDQLYFVDSAGMSKLHQRALQAGDEPGRLVEDAAGRIHVVLRGAHAIATLGRAADSVITRREVCAVPRGIAYDAAHDQLHVACAEGKLVTLGAEPTAILPTRTLDLGTDVRDVLVRGEQLFVTRFRAAQLLVLNAQGVVQETRTPRSFGHDEQRTVADAPSDGTCSSTFTTETVHVESTPNVAWRAIDVPNVGVTMLHQRSRTDEIQVTAGGYGAGSNCGSGIVQTAVTSGLDAPASATGDMGDLTLAVDIATDPEGKLLAVVAPGNQGSLSQLQVLPVSLLQVVQDPGSGAGASVVATGGSFAATPVAGGMGSDFAPCMSGNTLPDPPGQATALTFASPYVLAVQEREPAAISFYDLRTNQLRTRIDLAGASRLDTGHAIFHVRAGAGLACASCHPEGGDDGHVWTFQSIGARRTQTLRGGLLGTEPLHWNGDMPSFETLVKEVFVGRMSGFETSPSQTDALSHWLDRQPALHADAADKTAAERGKLLFESQEVRCSQCHAGSHLTNNQTANVGTGADLQVPSLKGVRFRTPLMHDGCAATLSERFSNVACGGGDKHGKTSQLSAAQIGDLTAYLETL